MEVCLVRRAVTKKGERKSSAVFAREFNDKKYGFYFLSKIAVLSYGIWEIC